MIGRAPPLAKRAPRAPGEPPCGPPHSFGLLRRADLDEGGLYAWELPERTGLRYDARDMAPGSGELPAGEIVLLPPNIDLYAC